MKKWLYTLLVVVLAACSNEIPEQQPAKRSGRTVLAYLISNSPKSLEGNLVVIWMYPRCYVLIRMGVAMSITFQP